MSRAVAIIAVLFLLGTVASGDEAADFFEARVRPILIKHCYECHTRAAEGDLRLDSRKAVMAGGASGPAVVSGKPSKSLLIQAVKRTHAEIKMPPETPLQARDVQALVTWVKAGAVWPASKVDKFRVADQHGITPADRAFWSYQPLQNPTIPVTGSLQHDGHPIDAFVIARLKKKKIKPNKLANSRTLIRRATFDLTGLPPTPAEVEHFARESSKDRDAAFRNLIERLLASPRYGERWGQHWLDLVRYADTAGDASDFPIPEAYKYRNYVIDAMNKDKPYDQFIREQVAGDLLPYEDDDERWEQIIATGYIAISRRIGVSPHGLRHITIEDTINNLGKTFLGLTIGCARCHDHKFDAIPTADYYSLYGIFDSSIYPHVGAEHKPHRADFVYRIGKKKSDQLLKSYREVLDVWNKRERAQLEVYRDFQRKDESQLKGTRQQAWQDLLDLREARRPHAEVFPDLEIAYAIHEGEAHDVQIQKAGDPRSSGSLVRRGFLQILGGGQLRKGEPGSGRRELAEWIADPKNPLTARVMVNRIWHHHFGKGLVRTTSDFGVRGTPPTHPRLLDFLASYFIEHGWSVKKMHRLIMSSQTYQLASDDVAENTAVDPGNDLVWRANRRRLDAEQIRDAILFFSGQLDLAPGGQHPFPHRLTYFYRQHEPFIADFTSRRRTVYEVRQRIRKNDFLDLFDAPDGNLHAGNRKTTTTTLQALYFMNSAFSAKQSAAMAARLMKAESTLSDRVKWAYRTVFGRMPAPEEVAAAGDYLAKASSVLESTSDTALQQTVWAGYLRGMISSNEFMFVD